MAHMKCRPVEMKPKEYDLIYISMSDTFSKKLKKEHLKSKEKLFTRFVKKMFLCGMDIYFNEGELLEDNFNYEFRVQTKKWSRLRVSVKMETMKDFLFIYGEQLMQGMATNKSSVARRLILSGIEKYL